MTIKIERTVYRLPSAEMAAELSRLVPDAVRFQLYRLRREIRSREARIRKLEHRCDLLEQELDRSRAEEKGRGW